MRVQPDRADRVGLRAVVADPASRPRRPAAGRRERVVLGAEGQEDRPAQQLPGLRLVIYRRVSE